jgi:hypothetical protein
MVAEEGQDETLATRHLKSDAWCWKLGAPALPVSVWIPWYFLGLEGDASAGGWIIRSSLFCGRRIPFTFVKLSYHSFAPKISSLSWNMSFSLERPKGDSILIELLLYDTYSFRNKIFGQDSFSSAILIWRCRL